MKMVLTLLILLLPVAVKSQVKRIGDNLYEFSESDQENSQSEEIKFNSLTNENVIAGYDASSPLFIWPFFNELDNGLMIVNYVDNFPGTTIRDYMGSNWTFEDHPGTDIGLNSFREMDRFVSVRAAESGTVYNVVFDNYDRNTVGSGTANMVTIQHSDGSFAFYGHLMKNSVTVNIGELVQKGSLIGYAGSSGNSTSAHLHFEVGFFSNGVWVTRDPWHGTYNTLPSMWESQYAYAGAREYKAHDMGVFTASSVGGNISNAGN